jgi:O-antigen/teichoic acid export membrane protein
MPLYASTLIGGLLIQYNSLTLARYTLNVEIGNYSIAQTFSAAVALITIPISTTLFPAFSKLDLKHEVKELKSIFKNSLKYTFLLLFPAATFIAFNSTDLVALFYGSSYTQAPLYLTLHSITFLYAGFSLVLGGFFNGIGRTDISLKAALIRLPVVLLLVPALTWLYGVQGFICALIISGLPSLLYTACTAHSQYGLDFGLKSIAKICVASLLSAASALVLATFLPYSHLIKLALTAPLFVLTYLTLAPLMGVIERQDIDNIALITKDIKPISKLIRIALSYEEKILSI